MISGPLHRILSDDDVHTDPGEARRFARHLSALTLTKVADGLIDPKLVLAWIMSAVGAPGYLVGALVPVRESGALLPQIVLARQAQQSRQRKWFWAAGSAVQGLAALGCAAAAILLDGAAAGWAIIACLAALALARAACSTSYKDILARTLQKGSRGTVSGAAGTVAAAAVLGFAALLSFGIIPLTVPAIAVAIAIAGAMWLGGAAIFAGLDEPAAEPDASGFDNPATLLKPLIKDTEFRTYIAVRGLLIATALAPPFIVLLTSAGGQGQELGNLGPLLLASATAAIVSSYVWGRLSDTSSRQTLMWSGGLATLALGGAALLGLMTASPDGIWAAAALLFVAQIAYEGVRAGRKTHLTDMDTADEKAVYTALSNTMIGVLLLAGGGFGLLADVMGAAIVLAVFAGMSAVAVLVAMGLTEVQQDGSS